MNRERKEDGGIRFETTELSDLFSLKEGRRPRLLIAYHNSFQEKRLHELASFFADLGCNVDISPYNSDISHIEKQCLENDSDMVLIFADESFQNEEFCNFLTNIFSQIPHIIPAVYTVDSNSTKCRQKDHLSWSFFDQNDLLITIASTLLKKLVS